jgi:hypothetical protein
LSSGFFAENGVVVYSTFRHYLAKYDFSVKWESAGGKTRMAKRPGDPQAFSWQA